MSLTPSILAQSVLWWIPFLLLLPFLFPVLLCLSIYKGMVVILSKLFQGHNLIRPISGLDISFCTDDFYGRPFGGLAFVWVIEGVISPGLVVDRFRAAVTCGECDYEKLTSVYPRFWLGYPFWHKTHTDFDIQKHVKVMEFAKANTTGKEGISINKQICEWILEPFVEGRPFWEVRVVPQIHLSAEDETLLLGTSFDLQKSNTQFRYKEHSEKYDNVKSILILKSHHMIGDGYSMLSLLEKIIDSTRFECPFSTNVTVDKKDSRVESEKVKKVQERKRLTMNENKKDRDGEKEQLSFQSKQNKSPNFASRLKICKAVVSSWSKASKSVLCQLSNVILLTFLTPSTLFSLLYDFGFHCDSWLTKKKDSVQMNLATVRVPVKRLNEIRRDLFKSQSQSQVRSGSANKGSPGLVPVIVVAVSALAGAVYRLLVESSTPEFSDLRSFQRDQSKEQSEYTEEIATDVPSTKYMVALPLEKKHPGTHTFCNSWTHGILTVKANVESPIARVSALHNFYNEILKKRSPEIYHSLVKFHSLLPEPLLRIITRHNMGAPVGITNMLGSPDAVFIGGKRVLHQYAFVGLLWRHASMTLGLISYNGEMTATVVANQSVIRCEKDVEKFLRGYFIKELEQLGHL